MRLDVRNKEEFQRAKRAKPFLNGVFVPKCVMADEEAGVIERWETDEQGRVIAFQVGDGERSPRLIREYGIVRIELAE